MQRTMRSESDCCCEEGGILSCASIATCFSGKYLIASVGLVDDDNEAGAEYRRWSVTGGTWLIREKMCGYPQGDFSSTLLCDAGDDIALGCSCTSCIAQWALGFRYSRHAPRRDGTPDSGSLETHITSVYRINVRLNCSSEGGMATLQWDVSLEIGNVTGIISPDIGSRCYPFALSPGVTVALPISGADLLAAVNADGALLEAVEEDPLSIGHLFSSAAVELLGVDCGPCVGAAPTINIEMDNTATGVDPCSPESESSTGCFFELSATTEAGDADLRECYWEDGVVGCDRPSITLSEECGGHELTLGVQALNVNGCVGETEETVSCCVCCPPSGSYGLDFAPFDEFTIEGVGVFGPGEGCSNPWGLVGCTDETGEHTVAAHRRCFFSLIFGEVETTDCGELLPNPGKYFIVVEGDLFLPDGSPFTGGCFDAEDEVIFYHDDGGAGGNACLKVTVVDHLGCSTELEPTTFLDALSYEGEPPAPQDNCLDGMISEYVCE